eukprot:422839_1
MSLFATAPLIQRLRQQHLLGQGYVRSWLTDIHSITDPPQVIAKLVNYYQYSNTIRTKEAAIKINDLLHVSKTKLVSFDYKLKKSNSALHIGVWWINGRDDYAIRASIEIVGDVVFNMTHANMIVHIEPDCRSIEDIYQNKNQSKFQPLFFSLPITEKMNPRYEYPEQMHFAQKIRCIDDQDYDSDEDYDIDQNDEFDYDNYHYNEICEQDMVKNTQQKTSSMLVEYSNIYNVKCMLISVGVELNWKISASQYFSCSLLLCYHLSQSISRTITQYYGTAENLVAVFKMLTAQQGMLILTVPPFSVSKFVAKEIHQDLCDQFHIEFDAKGKKKK